MVSIGEGIDPRAAERLARLRGDLVRRDPAAVAAGDAEFLLKLMRDSGANAKKGRKKENADE